MFNAKTDIFNLHSHNNNEVPIIIIIVYVADSRRFCNYLFDSFDVLPLDFNNQIHGFQITFSLFHLTFFARFKLIYLTKVKVYQISDLGTLICSRRTFINIKLILPDPAHTW